MDKKTEAELKTKDIKYRMDDLWGYVEAALKEAKLDGFEEGLAYNVKPPTDKKFREDHKEPQTYGEDMAYVVYHRSKKKAAELLETEEAYIEEIGVGWRAYEYEGELQVGYYIGRGTDRWTVWGVYL